MYDLKFDLKAVYYTVKVHNFDLQEKTTKNNNNTITAKWVKPKIVIESTDCKMSTFLFFINLCHYKAIYIHNLFTMKYFDISKGSNSCLIQKFLFKMCLNFFKQRLLLLQSWSCFFLQIKIMPLTFEFKIRCSHSKSTDFWGC